MQREIKNCPLVATLRNGNLLLFSHDVTISDNIFATELTSKTIANISAELFINGVDIASLSIDESRINYIGVEVV